MAFKNVYTLPFSFRVIKEISLIIIHNYNEDFSVAPHDILQPELTFLCHNDILIIYYINLIILISCYFSASRLKHMILI